MIMLKNLKKTASYIVFADQAIFSGSNFLLTFLLARLFSITEFGFYSYTLLITYFVLSISNAIIIQPFQIVVSKGIQQKALGFILKLLIVFLITIFIFMIIFRFTLSNIRLSLNVYNNNFSFYIVHYWEVSIFVLGYVFQDFFRKSLLAIQKIEWVLWIDILFLIIFPILFLSHFLFSETLLYIGFLNIISSIPGIIYFIKNADIKSSNKIYLNYHLQQGKWLLSTSMLQWFSNNFLVFVSGIYLGLESLGALRLVQSFFGILNVILQTVENFFLPKTAKIYHENIGMAKKYLSEIAQKGFLIFGILLIVFFIFSDQIIIFLGGKKYQDFGYVIKLITILYVFILYGYPVRIAIRILELNKAFFFGYILSFGFSVLSFHFLLKYTALYGAILGLIISQILMIFYWKYQLGKNSFLLWK